MLIPKPELRVLLYHTPTTALRGGYNPSVRILVTGGTGFVGSHLAPRLLAEGHHVRVLSRGQSGTILDSTSGSLENACGDVVTGAGLDDAARGCDAVIHLVGIIIEIRDAKFDDVHARGTRNVVAAAQRAGVRRFVQMSALGARPNGVSGYQTSKFAGEEAVRQSGMPFVILRPSIIFGARDGFVTQMVQVMKGAPLVRPVPGTGKYRFRPVWVGDVVECFVQALTSEKALGKTIEVVGPEELSLAEVLAEIARCVGVRKPAVKIPYPLMYLNALLLGAVLPRPPITTDQLRMLREGSTASPAPMLDTFNLQPVGFREGLRQYLCR
jgi:NADH dehydrogenase